MRGEGGVFFNENIFCAAVGPFTSQYKTTSTPSCGRCFKASPFFRKRKSTLFFRLLPGLHLSGNPHMLPSPHRSTSPPVSRLHDIFFTFIRSIPEHMMSICLMHRSAQTFFNLNVTAPDWASPYQDLSPSPPNPLSHQKASCPQCCLMRGMIVQLFY